MAVSESTFLCAVVLGCSVIVMAAPYPEAGGEPCQPDKLTVYKVVLQTFWTRDQFPKHYPDWRPSAQWSKLVGEYCSSRDMLVYLVTKSVIHVVSMHCLVAKFVLQSLNGSERIAAVCLDTRDVVRVSTTSCQSLGYVLSNGAW